jgi:hypothetical protein
MKVLEDTATMVGLEPWAVREFLDNKVEEITRNMHSAVEDAVSANVPLKVSYTYTAVIGPKTNSLWYSITAYRS